MPKLPAALSVHGINPANKCVIVCEDMTPLGRRLRLEFASYLDKECHFARAIVIEARAARANAD